MSIFEKEKNIEIYYLLLLAAMVLGSSSSPNIIVRIAFMIAFAIPMFSRPGGIVPAAITCFLSFISSTDGVIYCPLLYYDFAYYVLTIAALIFVSKPESFSSLLFYILIVLYVFFIDAICGSNLQGFTRYAPLVLLFSLFFTRNTLNHGDIKLFMNSFCALSLALSVVFFMNYQQFLVDYNDIGLERSGWNDPNYFSSLLGIGIVVAVTQLLDGTKKTTPYWLFLALTIILSFVAQILLASRGGILATAISVVILLLFIDIPKKYKTLMILLIAGFVVYLYNNEYFALLQFRMENDTTFGSSRGGIWVKKLDAFFSNGNVLNIIFGSGYEGGLKLGFSHAQGAHNEFVAVLTEYGFVGIILFITSLIKPLRSALKENKIIVLSMLAYFITVCMTLEPITLGNLFFLSFYLLIDIISRAEPLSGNQSKIAVND